MRRSRVKEGYKRIGIPGKEDKREREMECQKEERKWRGGGEGRKEWYSNQRNGGANK